MIEKKQVYHIAKPYLILIIGIPGSGKTFFAEKFAKTFSTPYLNLNDLRREIYNQPDYSKPESDKMISLASFLLPGMMLSGQAIIVEGCLDSRVERYEFHKIARAHNYEVLTVWVQNIASTSKIRATRQIKGSPRRNLISDVAFETLKNRFTPPNIREKAVVISGNHTFPTQVKIVLKNIVRPETKIIPEARQADKTMPRRRLLQ